MCAQTQKRGHPPPSNPQSRVLCGEEPREEPREESVLCGDKAGSNEEAGLATGQMERSPGRSPGRRACLCREEPREESVVCGDMAGSNGEAG